MNTDLLFKAYPWYRQHCQAVDTLASFLGVDVAKVLEGLDEKINPPARPEEYGNRMGEAA